LDKSVSTAQLIASKKINLVILIFFDISVICILRSLDYSLVSISRTRFAMGKRILVTGGAGFIGSHLCRKLLSVGHDILCVDNYFTGSRFTIAPYLENFRFELLRHDITSPLFVEVDEIYNLACPASPIHYQHDPVQTTKTSVIGTMNMLGLAKRLHAKILQASTSEVYGDPDVHPQTEDYCGLVNIRGPRACYDEGKRCAETLFYDYHRQHNLNIRVARIFNTYGPNMHPQDGRVVSNFIMQSLKGEPLTIYGSGRQTRSFCYVDDLIDGLIRLMEGNTNPAEPLNLGNPVEITIKNLALLIIELTGSRSVLDYQPSLQDDPRQRCPDITRARNLLGWSPQVDLKDGLLETIKYFDELLTRNEPAIHEFSRRAVA
jgi:UDP-glucuronate decarboxylase